MPLDLIHQSKGGTLTQNSCSKMADSQYPQHTQGGQESNTASITVANTETLASELQLSTYSSMPAQFALLEESPPADHHFLNHPSHLTALKMRRITKVSSFLSISYSFPNCQEAVKHVLAVSAPCDASLLSLLT